MMPTNIPSFKLNNGIHIPAIGLGMWAIPDGKPAEEAVRHALNAGYRLFDTASLYGNEASLGRAIRSSGIQREEVFVTTKLWNSDHGYDRALRAFVESLRRLGMEYVDLYLIHWPVQGLRLQTWQALEKMYEEGRSRAIGVSNYMIHHLEELLDQASVVPAVNQIELHPYNYHSRLETVEFCRSKGILVEAYSPLTKGRKLKDPTLVDIAKTYGRTPAQILLRWCYQHGFVAIPKASNPDHLRENASIFDFSLSEADMEELDSLDEGLATSWDPTREP
jgi:diketogulonate reductase-like aldo/keto reductase